MFSQSFFPLLFGGGGGGLGTYPHALTTHSLLSWLDGIGNGTVQPTPLQESIRKERNQKSNFIRLQHDLLIGRSCPKPRMTSLDP